MIESIVAIVLVLGLLIFFHELGHFLVARWMGIGVPVFSLGFGPKIFSFLHKGTEYRISAVPLGGYVKLSGQNLDDELAPDARPEESFSLRPPWQRILVVAAGPIFNFLLAFFIYWGLFWFHGQQELLPVIGQVTENSPAQTAGLHAGDRVLAIDGREISYWRELAESIQQSGERALVLTVLRDQQQLEITAQPRIEIRQNIFGEEIQVAMLGITASGNAKLIPLDPAAAMIAGIEQTWTITSLTVQGIIKLIERILPMETIGGPILIAQLVSEQAAVGLASLLALTALISINLAILNLLPIPVLDGGHILFYTLEAIRGKPLKPQTQEFAYKIGITFLVVLLTFAIYNDILRLLQ